IQIYQINIVNIWPLIIWNIIGLLFFMLYKHPLLFVVGILINLYAQIYSEMTFYTFSFTTLGILIIGYFYYTYKYDHPLYNYFFSIILIVQGFIYTIFHFEQYYWYMFIVFL